VVALLLQFQAELVVQVVVEQVVWVAHLILLLILLQNPQLHLLV
jgi:hypothetical protein